MPPSSAHRIAVLPCYFTVVTVRQGTVADGVQNAVAFEKKLRDRWREKNREKNARIAKLEARVAHLEQRLKNAGVNPDDLRIADIDEPVV